MSYVFATADCSITDPNTGLRVRLEVGQAWDAGDQLVKSRPDLFAPQPPVVFRTSGRGGVEQYTPEKRARRG